MFKVGLIKETLEMDQRRTRLHMKMFFGFQIGCDDNDIWEKICGHVTVFDISESVWKEECEIVQKCEDEHCRAAAMCSRTNSVKWCISVLIQKNSICVCLRSL